METYNNCNLIFDLFDVYGYTDNSTANVLVFGRHTRHLDLKPIYHIKCTLSFCIAFCVEPTVSHPAPSIFF